jgi:hypothetical protein
MIYTNITGKLIGECMTGFGINYPIRIHNSGNSNVLYTLISNDSNFLLSNSSLLIANGETGFFDVLFNATVTTPSGYESSIITISSESVEDGSTDPSGDISIYITGHRIVDTTGGHVRYFRALRNYDPNNGLNYDFYWRPATGTGNLQNYFYTGYKLEVSDDVSFSPLIVEKFINVGQNTSTPRYSTNYGYADEDIFININKNDYPFTIDTDYYARIYTITDGGVTGESVYATGIDFLNTVVSQEVLTGNLSVKNNIEFTKKSIDLYLPNDEYIYNYNAYAELFKLNYNSSNFQYINGINIYFPSNSTITSTNEFIPAFDLDGPFLNFTGAVGQPTNINLYLTNTTKIQGCSGKGGDLKGMPTSKIDGQILVMNLNDLKNQTTTAYSSNDSTCTDAKNGGDLFRLNLTSDIGGVKKDLVYNIYSEIGSSLSAGGGGSKASVAYVAPLNGGRNTVLGVDEKNNTKLNIFPLFGNFNPNKSVKYDLSISAPLSDQNLSALFGIPIPESSFANIQSFPSANGEDGKNSNILNLFANSQYFNNLNFELNNFVIVSSSQMIDGNQSLTSGAGSSTNPPFKSQSINLSTTSAGKSVFCADDASVNFYIKNGNIANDYLFYFPNENLTSNANWTDTTSSYQLTSSGAGLGSYNSSTFNLINVGKNSITLSQNQYLSTVFSSGNAINKNCSIFDLYIVLAYVPQTLLSNSVAAFKFKILDFGSTIDKTIDKQVKYTNQSFSIDQYIYEKEKNLFDFFIAPLFNNKINNASIAVINKLYGDPYQTSYTQLSKDLISETYYPMILNIKRLQGTLYSVYINGNLINTYDMGTFVENAYNYIISDLSGTTFNLNCASQSSSEKIGYFETVFYNRILNTQESLDLHNFFANKFFKLFIGSNSLSLDIKSNRVRLPNIFNLAGKI